MSRVSFEQDRVSICYCGSRKRCHSEANKDKFESGRMSLNMAG